VLHQPDRHLSRGVGRAHGRGPAGPETRGRRDYPGEPVRPTQGGVGVAPPRRYPQGEPAVRIASRLGSRLDRLVEFVRPPRRPPPRPPPRLGHPAPRPPPPP